MKNHTSDDKEAKSLRGLMLAIFMLGVIVGTAVTAFITQGQCHDISQTN